MKKSNLFVSALLLTVGFASGALAVSTFSDVTGHWAEKNIMWASTEGLVMGDEGKTTFRPDAGVTRAELVTVMKRYDDRMMKKMTEMEAKMMTAMDAKITKAMEPKVVAPVAMNLVDTLKADGNYKTLLELVTAAGLTETLNTQKVTIFAPTDAAFAALPAGTVDTWKKPENKAALAEALKYHVLSGNVMAAGITDGMKADPLAEGADMLTFMVANGKVTVKAGVNQAMVTKADWATDMGTIHVIDTVLMLK